MFIEPQFTLYKDLGFPFLLEELARMPCRHAATATDHVQTTNV